MTSRSGFGVSVSFSRCAGGVNISRQRLTSGADRLARCFSSTKLAVRDGKAANRAMIPSVREAACAAKGSKGRREASGRILRSAMGGLPEREEIEPVVGMRAAGGFQAAAIGVDPGQQFRLP